MPKKRTAKKSAAERLLDDATREVIERGPRKGKTSKAEQEIIDALMKRAARLYCS